MKKSILVIDDDALIRSHVQRSLVKNGFDVVSAETGVVGLKMIRENAPDLIVLDLNLPDIEGKDILSAVRNDSRISSIPIVVLTGNDQKTEEVRCLDSGADDYVIKTFEEEDLIAHVQAVLRRTKISGISHQKIHEKNLVVDVGQRVVKTKSKMIDNLTPKEFDLLCLLVENSPNILSRNLLAQKIWGGDLGTLNTRTIDVHIRRIRKKLGHPLSQRVVTCPGKGYRFTSKPAGP